MLLLVRVRPASFAFVVASCIGTHGPSMSIDIGLASRYSSMRKYGAFAVGQCQEVAGKARRLFLYK